MPTAFASASARSVSHCRAIAALAAVAGTACPAFLSNASAQSLIGDEFTYEVSGLSVVADSGTAVVGPGPEFIVQTASGPGDQATLAVNIDSRGVTVTADLAGDTDARSLGSVPGFFIGSISITGLDFSCSDGIADRSVSGTAGQAGNNDVTFTSNSVRIGSDNTSGNNTIRFDDGDTLRIDLQALPDSNPGVITNVFELPRDAATMPLPIPAKSMVDVLAGGALENTVIGSTGCDVTVNLQSGAYGRALSIETGAVVNVFDGATIDRTDNVTPAVSVRDGGVFNMYGGDVEDPFHVEIGGIANFHGGWLGAEPLLATKHYVRIAGELNMFDGYLANHVELAGTINMYGGEIRGWYDRPAVSLSGTLAIDSVGPPIINLYGGDVYGIASSYPDDAQLNIFGGNIYEAELVPVFGHRLYVDMQGGWVHQPTLGVTTVSSGLLDLSLDWTMRGGRLRDAWMNMGTYRIRGGAFNWDWLDPSGADGLTHKGTYLVYGERFALDGVPIAGLANIGDELFVDIPDGAVVTGVLEDGTPFEWANTNDRMHEMNFTFVRTPVEASPVFVYNDGDPQPGGITDGRTIEIESGDFPRFFRMEGQSTLRMKGGTMGGSIRSTPGCTLLFEGGSLVTSSETFTDATVLATGGDAFGISLDGDSTLDVQRGRVDYVEAKHPTTVSISGGLIDNGLFRGPLEVSVTGGVIDDTGLFNAATVDISNGTVDFVAYGGATINQTGGNVLGSYGNATINQSAGTFDGIIDEGTVLNHTGGSGTYIFKGGTTGEFSTGDVFRTEVFEGRVTISGGDWDETEIVQNPPPPFGDGGTSEVRINGVQLKGDIDLDFGDPDPTDRAFAEIRGTAFSIDGVDITPQLQEDTLVPIYTLWGNSGRPNPAGLPETGWLEVTLLDGQQLAADLARSAGTFFLVLDQQANVACNAADLAAPLGMLDLGDIDAFIAGFLASDLVADVAEPFGVLDLGDIDGFITGYQAGCP